MSTNTRSRRERGAAAVEMAIVLPLLLLIMGGVVEFGRALFIQNMATNAAREGARMRALGYTTVQATERVNSAMIGMGVTTFTVTYDGVAGAGAGTVTPNANCPTTPLITDRQRVTVNPNFAFIFPIPGVTPPTLSSQSEMRCGG
ncbi:TadE/TadG family type IV pilus assembly protein [Knoellia sp. CPCC 206435]|uniref:TadE/TadG family type IV pilus assembly protein n=1 Tax=Knoellia terrae TaxID=3404797 RepID=UPI003B437BBC